MAVMDVLRTWTELREHAPGHAYVTRVDAGPDEAVVHLSYAGGHAVTAAFPISLRSERPVVPAGMERVLSVNVSNTDDGVDCVAIGVTKKGPRREAISVSQALAFALDGTHTVFVTRGVDRP